DFGDAGERGGDIDAADVARAGRRVVVDEALAVAQRERAASGRNALSSDRRRSAQYPAVAAGMTLARVEREGSGSKIGVDDADVERRRGAARRQRLDARQELGKAVAQLDPLWRRRRRVVHHEQDVDLVAADERDGVLADRKGRLADGA